MEHGKWKPVVGYIQYHTAGVAISCAKNWDCKYLRSRLIISISVSISALFVYSILYNVLSDNRSFNISRVAWLGSFFSKYLIRSLIALISDIDFSLSFSSIIFITFWTINFH